MCCWNLNTRYCRWRRRGAPTPREAELRACNSRGEEHRDGGDGRVPVAEEEEEDDEPRGVGRGLDEVRQQAIGSNPPLGVQVRARGHGRTRSIGEVLERVKRKTQPPKPGDGRADAQRPIRRHSQLHENRHRDDCEYQTRRPAHVPVHLTLGTVLAVDRLLRGSHLVRGERFALGGCVRVSHAFGIVHHEGEVRVVEHHRHAEGDVGDYDEESTEPIEGVGGWDDEVKARDDGAAGGGRDEASLAVIAVVAEGPDGDEDDGLEKDADGDHGEEERRGIDAAGEFEDGEVRVGHRAGDGVDGLSHVALAVHARHAVRLRQIVRLEVGAVLGSSSV